MLKVRWPWRKSELPRVDPGQAHEFRPIDDPGIAAFAASGGHDLGYGSGIEAIATTDNFIRKSRCGVQGCGRERYDPIHAAAED
jgi:hypothetical protein